MIKNIDELYPMVVIPQGEAIVGSATGDPDELPVRRLNIKTFSIGKYPVTQKLYKEITGNNPSHHKGELKPVECVTWYDSIVFANNLSEACGLEPYYIINKHLTDKYNQNPQDKIKWTVTEKKNSGFRLLNEFEWEYVASDSSLENSWFEENSNGSTKEVGLNKANKLGLFDMLGNVSEWCFSWYSDEQSPGGYYRIHKGGSWYDDKFPLRKSYRGRYNPFWKNHTIGFRLGRSL